MSIKHKSKVALLSIASALFATQVANAEGTTIYLPAIKKDYGISAWVPDRTTLDELKACMKDSKANDACEITDAMLAAWKLIGKTEKIPWKVRNRSQGTDQAVYVSFTSDVDDQKSCQIGWHVQDDFWYSDCKGPLWGDGGKNTIYPTDNIMTSDAHLFTLAIGAKAGAGRAGNIIDYVINGFWLIDWHGQAASGLCPIDNPYTTVNESQCVH